METAAKSPRSWRFGVFEVDAREGQLRRAGRPVKLREQSFRILTLLLERPGEIVTREELRRVLWPSDTYVDFDHSLNTAVMKLRGALGDSADAPLYIETIPKRGYRFVAPVSVLTVPGTSGGGGPASSPGLANLPGAPLVGPAATDDGFRIAVLPFEYGGGNAEAAALAEGLADAVVAGLLGFSYLRVIASAAGSPAANNATELRTLGNALGARYVIKGIVRHDDTRLRVATQLLEASTGTTLWAETYEYPLRVESGFGIQDDLVPRIVSTVADARGVLPRNISEALRSKDIEQMSPYEAVLRSFAHFQRVTSEEHAPARWALERAIQYAPGRADCWAMLSLLYKEEYAHGFNLQPDPLGRAFTAAQRAIEAEPSNHLGYHALAAVLFFRREFPAFRLTADYAITLNPMDGFTIAYLGFLIAYSGEWERGCTLTERARNLNPHHPGWYWFAQLFDAYRKRDYTGAAEIGRRINMPQFWRTNVALAAAYGQLDEMDAARGACHALLTARPEFRYAAREELAKWWEPALVEHLLDGLRRAGLPVGEPMAAPDQSDDAAATTAEVKESAQTVPPEEAAASVVTAKVSAAPQAVAARSRRRRFELIGAIVGLLLIALGSLLIRRQRPNGEPAAEQPGAAPLRIVPVTTAPGHAISPSFSPDEREVAFIWDGVNRRHDDLYVQLLGSDLPLRLTYSKRGDLGPPAWSPDGREIAFTRCDGAHDGVYVVPALGGAERLVTTADCLYTMPEPIAWVDDGKSILMVDHCSPDGAFGVVLFSLASGEKRCLTREGAEAGADSGYGFRLSPDGRTIAFTRTTASLCCDIYTLPLAGGVLRHLTFDGPVGCNFLTNDLGCAALMWTPDSKSIVFASTRSNLPTLWRVPAQGGAAERVTTYPSIGSFSKDGRKFVYSESISAEMPAIWRADLSAAGGPVISNKKVVQTQYPEMDAQPSADGTRIAWMSIRTGFEEIWTGGASGEGALQLTRLERYTGSPRWSPDGRWIAFDSYTKNGAQIFVADAQGRRLRAITQGPADNVVPSWSRDGKSIYFSSKRTGSWQVWKHSVESGAESQLTVNGGFDPFESYDGHTIYYSNHDRAGIWSIPAKGGAETPVVAGKPQLGYWGHWAVTREGLYVLNTDADPRPEIEFYRFSTGRSAAVLALDKRPARLQPSMSASADGKTIYYSQYDRQSVIKMMEFSSR